MIALFPGSFDPVTLGHLEIIERASALFDLLVVGVFHNPQKQTGAFCVEERLALLERACGALQNVKARAFDGLVADAVGKCRADVIVRGVRTGQDIETELQMARLNRKLCGAETFFLAASPHTVHISASMVREIGRLGGDLAGLVPKAVLPLVQETLGRMKHS